MSFFFFFFFFFKGAKSKTIHLLVKRDQTSNGLYNISLILFLCFYKGCGGNWVGIKWLGSMSRGKGKKGGEEESKAIKSIHGKLKIMERERERVRGGYGSWSESCGIVKRLIKREK